MKVLVSALALLLVIATVAAGGKYHGGWYEEPKVIKIIKPVHVIKVIKHVPPPVPVIKYVKLYHSTSVGHPYHHYGGHGW